MINHKHIVNLRDVLASKTKIYIVSELATGGELFYKLGLYTKKIPLQDRFYQFQKLSKICPYQPKVQILLYRKIAGKVAVFEFEFSHKL